MMENLADRFERSAARWARVIEASEGAYPIPKGSLDDEAREGFDLNEESDAVAHAGLRLLSDQAITRHHIEVYDLLHEGCQSPIELPMVLALMTVARHHGMLVKLISGGHESGDPFEPTTRPYPDLMLRIELQAQLGDHRVDFLLTLEGSNRDSNGRLQTASRRMVVECDGHDFHERTKPQAKRDRGRDRLLQSFGFLIFRYTGQEIWEDVFACATQALDALSEPVALALSAQPPLR